MKRLALVLGTLSMMLGCREPYTVVPIAPAATLSKDWTEFRPAPPLLWSEPEEEVCFRIDSAHEIGQGLEIVEPSGERSVPDVELIADNGRSFAMDSHGFLGGQMVFSFKNNPSDLKSVQAIRIRNLTPLHISKLLWRGYDPAKVKR